MLQSEFERGSEICQAVVERHAALASDVDPSVARELWAPLVETTDFFDKYDAYRTAARESRRRDAAAAGTPPP